MSKAFDSVIAYAKSWEGYLEKATNNKQYYDDKTANAGDKNFNRFSYLLDSKFAGLLNGKKDGYAWCACFIAACVCEVLGADALKKLMWNFMVNCAAGPEAYRNGAIANKAWITTELPPQAGDLIIFKTASNPASHIGFVTDYKGGKVYTIEGNTSSAAGTVANGGAVRSKSYATSYSGISGYVRWDWRKVDGTPVPPPAPTTVTPSAARPQIHKGSQGAYVKECQTLLNKKGASPLLSVDGDFGAKTDAAVRVYQKANGLVVDGYVGAKTWASLLA